jgi:long-chain fatty acid transport protein
MRNIIIAAILAAFFVFGHLAHAGGFELIEQSPQGVATVGAQTAVANDASAIYYNPAGLAFQPGFGALVGGNVGYVSTQVDSTGQTVSPQRTAAAPTVYVAQRLGKHWAIGLGSFANFAEHFKYPQDFNGRFLATFVDVTTGTINPVVAWRPIKQLALAVGLDVLIASVDLYQALNFGGGEGTAHAGLTGVGVGGNAGLMVEAYKQYLKLGFSYRSRVDVNFDGKASLTVPPELQGMVPGLLNSKLTLPFPHNFAFALSSRPVDRLILSADVHYTLWSALSTLTLNETAPGTMMSTSAALQLHNSWGVRFGGELRFLDERLRFLLGVGWDQTPVPTSTLGPLLPDTDRVLVGGGFGWHSTRYSLQAAYLAAILLKSTSGNPDFRATYSTVGHVVSAAFTLRFADVGGAKLSANQDPTWR